MKHFANNGSKLRWGLVCCLLLLSACAGNVSKESQIEERATARWDALLSNDVATAYEYLSPGYRSSVSLNQYQRSLLLRQVSWTTASYKGSECTEVSCKVKISLDYVVRGAIPGVKEFKGTQNVAESWVSVGGVWYLVPDK
jgi:hypothetical protein